MVITFPCSICTKTIDDNDNSINCDKCSLWLQTTNIIMEIMTLGFVFNLLLNQFNNSSQIHDFKDLEDVVSCKYYPNKMPNKKNYLSLFHINACSLSKNFDDLEYLLKTTNANFDIIAISETRILKNTKIVKNINIPNFSYEFTPTESTAGGTLIYIADHLAYQKRNDLTIYAKNYLESTFIEITNPSLRLISLWAVSTDIQQWILMNSIITILIHF